MAVFTSWTALLEQLRNDLASGAYSRVASYTLNGRTVTYRSVDEFWKLYREVEAQAAAEDGLAYAEVRTVSAWEW
jgi:hypothetical protein